MVHSVRIRDAQSPYYPLFWEAASASFPLNERRSEAAQAAALEDRRYRLDAWLEGGGFAGFMGWWEFADFRYIEHVAVVPGLRCGGRGEAILRRWLAFSAKPALLEIEEAVDGITRRRLAFYLRLGFQEMPGVHIQPSYQGGGPGVRMQALSWPERADGEQRAALLRLLTGEVWATLSG